MLDKTGSTTIHNSPSGETGTSFIWPGSPMVPAIFRGERMGIAITIFLILSTLFTGLFCLIFKGGR